MRDLLRRVVNQEIRVIYGGQTARGTLEPIRTNDEHIVVTWSDSKQGWSESMSTIIAIDAIDGFTVETYHWERAR